jgi:hypothetical protein
MGDLYALRLCRATSLSVGMVLVVERGEEKRRTRKAVESDINFLAYGGGGDVTSK